MWYVLKYTGLGPDHFLEHCYDEVVTVRNQIALVQFEHNKNMLLGMQYEEIGQVENAEDVDKLLAKDDTVELKVKREQLKTIPIEKILPKPGTVSSTKKFNFELFE